MEPTNNQKIDIRLVPTNDLIAELFARHDAAIFAGKTYLSLEQYKVTRRFHGNRDACLAICSNLESIINNVENESLGPSIE